jgi:hypothetical protein
MRSRSGVNVEGTVTWLTTWQEGGGIVLVAYVDTTPGHIARVRLMISSAQVETLRGVFPRS